MVTTLLLQWNQTPLATHLSFLPWVTLSVVILRNSERCAHAQGTNPAYSQVAARTKNQKRPFKVGKCHKYLQDTVVILKWATEPPNWRTHDGADSPAAKKSSASCLRRCCRHWPRRMKLPRVKENAAIFSPTITKWSLDSQASFTSLNTSCFRKPGLEHAQRLSPLSPRSHSSSITYLSKEPASFFPLAHVWLDCSPLPLCLGQKHPFYPYKHL